MGHTCLKCPQPVTWTVFPIFEITQESQALVISVQALCTPYQPHYKYYNLVHTGPHPKVEADLV